MMSHPGRLCILLLASAARPSRKRHKKREALDSFVPDFIQKVFTDHLMCAERGVAAEKALGSGLQSERKAKHVCYGREVL